MLFSVCSRTDAYDHIWKFVTLVRAVFAKLPIAASHESDRHRHSHSHSWRVARRVSSEACGKRSRSDSHAGCSARGKSASRRAWKECVGKQLLLHELLLQLPEAKGSHVMLSCSMDTETKVLSTHRVNMKPCSIDWLHKPTDELTSRVLACRDTVVPASTPHRAAPSRTLELGLRESDDNKNRHTATNECKLPACEGGAGGGGAGGRTPAKQDYMLATLTDTARRSFQASR